MHEPAKFVMRGLPFAHPTCTRCSCVSPSYYGDIANHE
jgi:hypothetical protein